ncbi:MAG: outer rane efflux protein [Bryobacterales bacterium]|nr:outer rane efflux protein [Bryobacterales bacterium]
MKTPRLVLAVCMLPLWTYAQSFAASGNSQNAFTGSVPQQDRSAGEYALSLQDAVTRALKYNLGTELAGENRRAASGQRLIELSRLLPNIDANVRESSQQNNLAAFGLSLPGFPQIVGPFGLTDARASLSQQIVNFRSINRVRASSQEVRAAELTYKDARETVVALAASLYLQAASGLSRIEAAQAQVTAAQALYDQALDFRRNGVIAGIDVLRAQVQLQSQQQRLIAFRNDFEKQKLSLGRAIGLPDGAQLRLTDKMPEANAPLPSLDDALTQSYTQRKDFLSEQARVTAAELSVKAARASRLPSLGFIGDYGALGPNPTNAHGTYTAAISLNIPVWEGGRISGEIEEADANLKQLRARLADLKGRIGFEIRSAVLDLNAAKERLDVNRSAVELARQQEIQARDRFVAGVANNLEVVQAQEAVAAANENLIASLYAFNIAKADLARATGIAETHLIDFLQGAH